MTRGALLIILVVIAHAPALRGGFLWDDLALAVDHPVTRAPDGVVRFWTTTDHPDYWPLTYTLFWVERRLFGLTPWPYRGVNLALHVSCVLLVWRILERHRFAGAWFAAALFGVHPVTVEAVGWIFQQKTLLSALFVATSIMIWPADPSSGSRWRRGLSALLFFLAMAAKTAAVPLAIILPVLMTPRDRWRWGPLFLGIGFAMGGVAWWFQRARAIAGDPIRTDHGLERIVNGLGCLGHDAWISVVPLDLSFVTASRAWTGPTAWAGLCLLAALLAIGWRWHGGLAGLTVDAGVRAAGFGSRVLVGLMVFMLFLAPTLGVTDIYFMRFSLVADHWTYLALPALLAVLVSLGGQLPIGRALKLGVGWLLILTAIGLCRERSLAFVDEETLWRDTIRKNPAAWMAWDNLAAALERAGRRDEAKDAFREAIRRAPSEPSPRMHLGMCLAARGQLREALAVYGETERMERRVAGLHHWTAAAHERLGELDQAEHHYREEVRARPTFAAPRIALGEFLARRRRFPEALREFEKAVRLEPRDRTAADRLAVLIRLIDADPSPSAPIPGATAPR